MSDPAVAAGFFSTYFLPILQEIFYVLTGSRSYLFIAEID